MAQPSIIGVHHVKFPVSNLQQSRDWYERVLGLQVLVDFPDEDGVVRGLAGLLPGLGTLGDRYGHRRLFIAGLVVFGVASVAAAYAPNAPALIAGRAGLGVGAALMMPATLAIIRATFTAQRERAFIQRLIDDCRSKDEIKTALVAEFGDEVLAEPGDDGFEIAAYLIPLAALLGAGTAIALGVRRWRRPRPGRGRWPSC